MATIQVKAAEPATPPEPPVPPLENGDRLTRLEFERRYDAMPLVKKAELIGGVVYMGSPVSHERHGKPHFHVIAWLAEYWLATPGVDGGDNSSLRLGPADMPQPDAFLYILPAAGGQARIGEEGYVEGAPELVAEVASSSVSYDLHDKRDLYRRSAVLEYLVWRVQDREIDWFFLKEGQYERRIPGADGLYRSEVFPGLWLDPVALIFGDRTAISRASQQGLASPEHAAFVAGLAQRSQSGS